MNPVSLLKNAIFPPILPCSVLFREPLILISFLFDFYRSLDAFARVLPKDRTVHLIVQLGYQCETEDKRNREILKIQEAKKKIPNLDLTVFCNTLLETEGFLNAGIPARHIHQNVFLDERRSRILPDMKKEFDAIYVARVTPCKRHELAAKIPALLVIGDHLNYEQAYYDSVRKILAHADWKTRVRGFFMYREMNRAKAGLCLSAIEGAMYVSAEYLLCGLPVVNTPNIGGRDELFPEEFVFHAEPDPDSVADAVRRAGEAHCDPFRVRAAVLEKMKPFREKYLEFLHEILAQEHADRPLEFRMGNAYCFHKMGLRCPLSPIRYFSNGLRAPR